MNKTVMEKIDFGLLLTPFIHRINFYMIFTVFGRKKNILVVDSFTKL